MPDDDQQLDGALRRLAEQMRIDAAEPAPRAAAPPPPIPDHLMRRHELRELSLRLRATAEARGEPLGRSSADAEAERRLAEQELPLAAFRRTLDQLDRGEDDS